MFFLPDCSTLEFPSVSFVNTNPYDPPPSVDEPRKAGRYLLLAFVLLILFGFGLGLSLLLVRPNEATVAPIHDDVLIRSLSAE